MPTTFRAYQPDQPLLLPPDLQEWVPPGHLAHHVSDVVDALDLTAFYAPYEGDGRRNAPYEPSMKTSTAHAPRAAADIVFTGIFPFKLAALWGRYMVTSGTLAVPFRMIRFMFGLPSVDQNYLQTPNPLPAYPLMGVSAKGN